MAEPKKNSEEEALRFFLLIMLAGLVVVGPWMALKYAARATWRAGRFTLGLPGRPFGRTWFAPTRRVAWQTNFLGMPADDADLARWLAAQPGVVACEVRREPYWVVFDCVLRGYFLDPDGLKLASVRQAQALGYDTGGRIAIIDIAE